MKKLTLLILLAFLVSGIQAQEETKKGKSQSFGAAADLYTDIWMDAPDDIELRLIHQGISLGGMFQSQLGESPFSIAVGAMISTHNLYSNASLDLDTAGNSLFSALPEKDISGKDLDYDRNKLSLAYLDFPLEFRLKTDSEIRVALGFKAGFNINSHTKYKGDNPLDAESKMKVKYADLPNIENYRYGLVFRLGYKAVNLFGFYSLSPVFTEGKGPAVYPFSVGVSLRPY
jgi:hypothetical protein